VTPDVGVDVMLMAEGSEHGQIVACPPDRVKRPDI
jgi:hypothetical protein